MLSLRRSAIVTCLVCLAAFFVALYVQHHQPIPYQYPDLLHGPHSMYHLSVLESFANE